MNRFLRIALLLCAWLTVTAAVAETLDELKSRLAANTYYRLKSYYNTYAVDAGGKALTIASTSDLTNAWNSIWKIVPYGDGYTLQNVLTENYLNSASADYVPLPISSSPQTFYLKPSSYTASGNYVVLSWTSDARSRTVMHADGSKRIVRWDANTSTASNNASDWTLEPITSINETALEDYRTATTPVQGAYYYIVNNKYTGKRMQSPVTTTAAIAADADATDYRQLWLLEQLSTGEYAFKNVATGLYIQNNAGQSRDFLMGANASPFSLSFSTGNAPFTFSAMGTSYALHAAATASYRIVGWTADSEASQWYLERSTVTPSEVQASVDAMREIQTLIANRLNIVNLLATFFEDAACTQLKTEYQNKSDEELRNAMVSVGLPVLLQDMALRVKNNRWNSYSELANQYEKSFRIATYIPHSDPNKWAQRNDLMRTSFIYSQLTSPTGITASKGDVLCLFVDQEPPTGTTLKAELAIGINRTGRQITLKQGVNFIYVEGTEHVYIHYNIEDVNLRIADLPEIKIHIENGRANGCFDISKHGNEAWRDMLTLKGAGFMQDDEWRMKSKRYTYIFKRSDVEQSETNGDYMYKGEYKGLKGVLTVWDAICEQQLDFLSVDRYAERFNSLLLSVNQADGNLYATNYGIYGVTALRYQNLVESYENSEGAGYWALAHETGHHFQQLFNMQGALESSNNLFSNVGLWKMGSNVSRGMSLPTLIKNCVNSGNSWMDIGLSERMRLYWQLYLYYVELGHKPTFFQELMDKFRSNPMQSGNGRTDFLLFAKYCSEVAGEDLTEFFECYGFFRKTGTSLRIMWGDSFYDNSYAKQYTNVTQEDIDDAKAFMAQFDKKRNNLFFIDDRIRPTENKNIYMLPGAARYGTSGSATPGDVNEVGDLGHFEDFAEEKVAKPHSVQLQGRTFTMTGEDVVGYKVYDENGNLVLLSNRNCFDIPDNLNLATLRVVAAGSDGGDVTVYENGSIKPEYDRYGVDRNFKNTAVIAVSTDESTPEYLYNIYLTTNNTAYLDGNTVKAASTSDRGKYAFYAGTTENTYYIYSATVGKWLGYSDTKDGNNKVILCDTKGSASQWRIVREAIGGTSVDILPMTGTSGWNWYGGISTARTSMGLYNMADANSSWTLQPFDAATTFAENNSRIDDILSHNGAGYPAENSAVRTALLQNLADYQASYAAFKTASEAWEASQTQENQTAMMTAYGAFLTAGNNLKTATNNYISATTDITMPENGKIYRIRYVHNKRALTHHQMPDDVQTHNITLAPCTDARSLWVCQYNADGTFYFASLIGNGCISVLEDGSAGTLSDRGRNFTAARGSKFGTLYLRTGGYSLMGATAKNYLVTTTAEQVAASNTTQSTDFYFEEVADSAYALSVKEGSNGNLSTLHLPYAVILPEGVVTYSTTRLSEKLRLNKHTLSANAEGKTILPAYTAVILSSQEGGTLQLHPAMSSSATIQTGMEGTISRVPNDQLQLSTYNYYAMTQVNGVFLMRKIRNAAIPANKAYYRIAIGAAGAPPMSLDFIFEDETTNIGVVKDENAEKNDKMYDLSGRRIKQKPARGIIIMEGKKVIQR